VNILQQLPVIPGAPVLVVLGVITAVVSLNEAVGCRGHDVTSVSEWWGHGSGERRKTERKCCPIATLSTTNPTSTGLNSYPVLRGEKPATDSPSHDTFLVLQSCYIVYVGKDADFKMDLGPCASG